MLKKPRMIKRTNFISLTLLLLVLSSLVLPSQTGGLDGNQKSSRSTRLRRSTCGGRGCHSKPSQPQVDPIRRTTRVNKHSKRGCKLKPPQIPQNTMTGAQQTVDHILKRLEAFKTQMDEGRTLVQAEKWTKAISLHQGNHCTKSPQDVDHIQQRLQAFKTQMDEGRTLIQAAKFTKAILQKEHDSMTLTQDVDHIEKRREAFKTQMDEGKTLIQAAKWTKAILQRENDSMNLLPNFGYKQDCADEQEEEEEEEEEAEEEEEKEEEEEEAEEEQQEQKEAAEEQKQKHLAEEKKQKQEATEKQKQEDVKEAKDFEDQAKLKEKKEQEKKDKAQASRKLAEVKKGKSVKTPVPTNQQSTVIQVIPKPNPQPVFRTGTSTSASSSPQKKQLSEIIGTADSSQFSSFENYKHGSHEGESESARWVALHNSIRNKYFTPPVQWSEDLREIAKKVSETCVFEHSHGETGENIAAGEMDLEQVVHDWAYGENESSVYDPQNPMYSHFTQIVWKHTTHIGCAYTGCETIKDVPWTGNSKFWVCEYNPPGNYAGEFIANVNAVKGGIPLKT